MNCTKTEVNPMSPQQAKLCRLIKAIEETRTEYKERAFDLETMKERIRDGKYNMAIQRARTIIEIQINISTRAPELERLVGGLR